MNPDIVIIHNFWGFVKFLSEISHFSESYRKLQKWQFSTILTGPVENLRYYSFLQFLWKLDRCVQTC